MVGIEFLSEFGMYPMLGYLDLRIAFGNLYEQFCLRVSYGPGEESIGGFLVGFVPRALLNREVFRWNSSGLVDEKNVHAS